MTGPPRPPQQGENAAPDPWEAALRNTLGAPPARKEYVSELAERVSVAYAEAMLAEGVDAGGRDAEEQTRGRVFRLRAPTWVAAAAAVLVAAVWMSSGSSVSWASMIAAIKRAEWVGLVARVGGQEVSSWFSGGERVLIVRTPDGGRVDDRGAGSRLYAAADGGLEREALAFESEHDAPLVELLVNSLHDGPTDGPVRYRVLSERVTPAAAGRVQLNVMLAIDDPPLGDCELFLDVDSKTHLPVGGAATIQGKETAPLEMACSTKPPVATDDDNALLAYFASARTAPLADRVDLIASPLDSPVRDAPTPSPTADRTGPPRESPTAQPVVAPSVDPEARSEPLPPPRSIQEMRGHIDRLLRDHWREHGIEPVGVSSDAEFVRRVYLDLTGRIPTVNEVREFLRDETPDRRWRLINDLVGRYDHATHLATLWRKVLIPDEEPIAGLGGSAAFESWLTARFRNNTPYDELVSEMLLAEGRMSDSGPLLFYAAQKLQPEEIARQASRAFLGVRMDCAQCHDDFFDDRWAQRDFWAFAAFFAQLSQPDAMIQRVSPVMRLKDASAGEVTLPDSNEVIPPRFPMQDVPLANDSGVARRGRLVAWLTAPENPHFARATVNRAWATLFGRGLVNPLDDMRPDNRPIAPELLDALAEYFIRCGYDLRRLLVTLAATEAYQLSSAAPGDAPERRERFAQMNLKPFTAEQLYDGIATATRVGAFTEPNALAGFQRVGNTSRNAFLAKFRTPPGEATEYQSGITQALTLMNGGLTNAATDLSTSGLLKSLGAPFLTEAQRVEVLFLATVSRPPTDSERDAVLELIGQDPDPRWRGQVLGDALWALLNSAEFSMNH